MSKFITNVERDGNTFIVNFPQNPDYEPTQPRTNKVVLKYPGGSSAFTLTQDVREIVYYFVFKDNMETTISKTIESGTTSLTIPIDTNYEGITFGDKPSWVTNVSLSSDTSGKIIKITTLQQEEEQPQRECNIDVKIDERVLGTFTIVQKKGKDIEIIYKYVFVTTNTNEIIVQKSSADTTETIYATSENYYNFSAVTQNSEWLTASCDNNGNVTYRITAQEYNTNPRNGTVKVYASTGASDYNRLEVGTITVKQDAGETLTYSYVLNGTTTTGTSITENYSSAATSVTIAATNNNYYNFSVETNYPWITCSIDSDGNVSYSFDTQQPNTEARSGSIIVYGYKLLSEDTEIKQLATITINQAAGEVQMRNVTIIFPKKLVVEANGHPNGALAHIYITTENGGELVQYSWECEVTPGRNIFNCDQISQFDITIPTGTPSKEFIFNYESNGGSGNIIGSDWLERIVCTFDYSTGSGDQSFIVDIPADDSTVTLGQANPNLIINYS